MPAYNASGFIGRAIRSVLQQSLRDFELIVVDDCSSDNTGEIARETIQGDSRVRIEATEINRGPGHARNIGIDAAKGEWITFIDADDWYCANRLELLVDLAKQTPSHIVADNQYFYSDKKRRKFRLLFDKSRGNLLNFDTYGLLSMDKPGGVANVGLIKPFIEKSIVDNNKLRFSETKALGEDFYFLLSCVSRSQSIRITTKPLYNYRVYESSMSNTLGIQSYRDILKIHDSYQDFFQSSLDEKSLYLLSRRRQQLMRYIQYQEIITPLKAGNFYAATKQLYADPMMVFVSMPLVSRYFTRRLERLLPLRQVRDCGCNDDPA